MVEPTSDSSYNSIAGATVGAVILAGGLARRMGGIDKGLVMLAGKPMVQHTLATLMPRLNSIIINANRNFDTYAKLGVPVVADSYAGHLGPLAGLSAAIVALPTDYIFMCPCDSPFLQLALFDALLNGCMENDADIAVPHDGERLQPVFCVVHRRVLSSLNQFLESGERKIDRWFESHTLHQVPAAAFTESFRNINTEDERLMAEQGFKA